MTRKDYELIADVLHTMPNSAFRGMLTLKFCIAFKKDNPRFKQSMFVERVHFGSKNSSEGVIILDEI
jgi:hypothetical protein